MIKPFGLKRGDTVGIFTPSSPGYALNPGLFENGLRNIEKLGFKVKLGSVTAALKTQGYRSAPAQERAEEMMELIRDNEVKGLIATIGGTNSSSLIPFLDFDAIRDAKKVICGFSDITSLHLAIAKYSDLQTFYGPTAMCWFGDWPDGIPESAESFMQAVSLHHQGEREVQCPARWSNHKRRWDNDDWKNQPREWQANTGWHALSLGEVKAEIIPANFNTLMSSCGTNYFPDIAGKILLIEDMDAPQSRTERSLRQLDLMGVFDKIGGLVFSKPEFYDQQGAPFDYEQLIQEVVGPRSYPIVSNFDCGHTIPMITIPRYAPVRLVVNREGVQLNILDGSIVERKS